MPKSQQAKRYLKYEFSEDETRLMSRELSLETARLAETKEQKKAAMATFADTITSKEATLSRLSRLINNGYEFRDIECEITFDSPKRGMKTVVRIDTGEEVAVEKMQGDELQEEMPL